MDDDGEIGEFIEIASPRVVLDLLDEIEMLENRR